MASTRPDTSVHEFVERWRGRNLTERQAAHTHFIDLCNLLGVESPLQDRSKDDEYRFDAVSAAPGSKAFTAALKAREHERTETSPDGQARLFPGAPVYISAKEDSHGWVDVWKKGHFCWEYKRPGKGHKTLEAALAQLKAYKDSLDNPPLLIVCDIDHFQIHTNFTGHPATRYDFTIEDLARPPAHFREKLGIAPIALLHKAFTDPQFFRPTQTVNDITADIAKRFGEIAIAISDRKGEDGKPLYNPYDVAHFLMQIIFALFAEDVTLLPADTVLDICRRHTAKPDTFTKIIRDLFDAMSTGGTFGDTEIEHFNGGLFTNLKTQKIPRLLPGDIGALSILASKNWAAIEPSIIGTLFERSLDPNKRAQIGAHYTSRDDILLIVEPVVMAPLRRQWDAVRADSATLVQQKAAAKSAKTRDAVHEKLATLLQDFAKRLASVTILDPACGSGNFLYVTLQQLLDLEKEVIAFAAQPDIGVGIKPRVNPLQLRGIEINEYAAELARVSVWIGYLKWKRENGVMEKRRPILDKLDTIENRDAILDRTGRKPKPASWPDADFIIGNPPFLGSKVMRAAGMTDDYLDALFGAYDLPNTIDLVCYWFELARRRIEKNKATRAGLLATQGIRGGDNRTVLERIKNTGDIFLAWQDREWVLDGAAVQVSMIGFDDGSEVNRELDGAPASKINPDLSSGADISSARMLAENADIAFMGDTKGGAFDVTWEEAAQLLAGANPAQAHNSDVVVPWTNGLDVTRRNRGMFIIDFGVDAPMEAAVRYETPFRHVEQFVKPERVQNRRAAYAAHWWIHVEPRPDFRVKLKTVKRFIGTARVAKFRLFAWLDLSVLPDSQVIAFIRDDDYFFGVLQSVVHTLWSLHQGTQLENRPRYTPSTTFETFPLPWPPGREPVAPKTKHHALWHAISVSAKELNQLREGWVNPPEWIADVDRAVGIKYRDQLAAVHEDVRPLVHRSAVMAEAAKHPKLKLRTLTNLYNERPAWLRLAHKKLDQAVLAAYRAVDPAGDWDESWADVYEPFGAGEITDPVWKPKKGEDVEQLRPAHQRLLEAMAAARAARAPIDEKILANLLRLNLARPAATKSGRTTDTDEEVADDDAE